MSQRPTDCPLSAASQTPHPAAAAAAAVVGLLQAA